MDPKPVKRGDDCPRCGANAFMAARVPTDAQYAKAFDRENPTGLPEGYDTAAPDFRKEHGDLYHCVNCHYQTRFPAEAPAAAAPAAQKAMPAAPAASQPQTSAPAGDGN